LYEIHGVSEYGDKYTFYHTDFYKAYAQYDNLIKTDTVVLTRHGKTLFLPNDFQLKNSNAKFWIPYNGSLVKLKLAQGKSIIVKDGDRTHRFTFMGYHLSKLTQYISGRELFRCSLLKIREKFFTKGKLNLHPPMWKIQ